MVTIPRYQSRVGVPLRGQEFAKQFGLGTGAAFRDVAQLAAAADTVVDGARTLWDQNEARGPEQRREMEDQRAVLEAQQREIAWRVEQLGQGDQGAPMDAAGIARSLGEVASQLSPAAKGIFERRMAPRAAAWRAHAQAEAARQDVARQEAMALQREILGVEEYVRHADVDETLGRLALASAVAQRGERVAAAGVAAEAVKVGKQALLAEAEALRIQRAIGENPEKAAALLATRGEVLARPERDALAREIAAEQVRVEAAGVVAKIAGQKADLADDLEGLTAEVEAAAGEDPARRAAYHSAALGVWRGAKAARETAEEAGWQAVAPLLEAQSGVRSWTEVPGPIWAALSGRQREMVKAWLDDPDRGSDPALMAWASELARNDPRAFGEIDLTAQGSRLTPPDHTVLRRLQQSARDGGESWANDRDSWLAARGEAEPQLFQKAAWKRGDAAPPLAGSEQLWRQPPQATVTPEMRNLLILLAARPQKGEQLAVDPATGRLSRVVRSDALIGRRPLTYVPVSDLEVQRFIERQLGAADWAFGRTSPEAEKMLRQLRKGQEDITTPAHPAKRELAAALWRLDPRVQAFLTMVSEAEGAEYDSKSGDLRDRPNKFFDFSHHPGWGRWSTSSGRYQLVDKTYKAFANQLGLTDFSPATQDLVATQILLDRGVLERLRANDFEGAMAIASKDWMGLAQAPGKPNRDPKQKNYQKFEVSEARYKQLLAEATIWPPQRDWPESRDEPQQGPPMFPLRESLQDRWKP